MPRNNRFRHQVYRAGPPTAPVQLLRAAPPPTRNDSEFLSRMQAVGHCLRSVGVTAVYLVHGTFIGPDSLGLLADLSRLAPNLSDSIRGWNKQLLDTIARDVGNFPPEYAETWQSAMNSRGDQPIPVRLFHWSSENHHLGRADGAVRLLAELLDRHYQPGDRVLLVGHSHGGNVFALLTNLIGSDRDARHAFFHAARNYYRSPILGRIDLPLWETVRQRALAEEELFPQVHLDIATLGTPVRYGWDTNGCQQLLHFINHRPAPDRPEYQAVFPPQASDLWSATYGDFIQQLGIAGTNLSPPIWAWRAWNADLRLGRLLQSGDSFRDLLARLKLGIRAHQDGHNLLIDYGPAAGAPAQHLFGHAVYTRLEWLLFHAEEIAQRMYGLSPATEI